ncbi:MAG: hypothetical protein RLZZ230_358 [Candidatus Parcubacteria bacterium]|jgi:hypothetical protein
MVTGDILYTFHTFIIYPASFIEDSRDFFITKKGDAWHLLL